MKSDRLYAFFEQKLAKLNKEINRYLDSRSGLSEEARIAKWQELKDLQRFYERVSISVFKEEKEFESVYHPKMFIDKPQGHIAKVNSNEGHDWAMIDTFGGRIMISY